MLPAKVEQMMFPRLNRGFIPEIRALNKRPNRRKKKAAAKRAEKVAVVQRAAEGSYVAVAL